MASDYLADTTRTMLVRKHSRSATRYARRSRTAVSTTSTFAWAFHQQRRPRWRRRPNRPLSRRPLRPTAQPRPRLPPRPPPRRRRRLPLPRKRPRRSPAPPRAAGSPPGAPATATAPASRSRTAARTPARSAPRRSAAADDNGNGADGGDDDDGGTDPNPPRGAPIPVSLTMTLRFCCRVRHIYSSKHMRHAAFMARVVLFCCCFFNPWIFICV